ncbi:MAG: FAD-dependent oxidoreductase [Caldilineaceae bacterium]
MVDIHGQHRVEAVTVAPVDATLTPDLSRAVRIPCDTLLLSIGLIPDNQLAHQLRLRLDPVTQGPVVTSAMETSMSGVFACGNTVHIHDLVDFVSQEAALAGERAAQFVQGALPPPDNVRLTPGENVAYCVPQTLATEREQNVVPARAPSVGGVHAGILHARRRVRLHPQAALRLPRRDGQHHHAPAFFGELSRRRAARQRATALRGGGMNRDENAARHAVTTTTYLCIGCPLGCGWSQTWMARKRSWKSAAFRANGAGMRGPRACRSATCGHHHRGRRWWDVGPSACALGRHGA